MTLYPRPRIARLQSGFTMMEILVAVAILGILATLAVPSFHNSIVRDQIVKAVPLAELAKKPVEVAWLATQTLPADNAAAGLPAADKIVNNHIRSVAVHDGAIRITFGNNASPTIAGRILTLRPAVVEDAPVVPVAWVCGHAAVPDQMTVKGDDATDVPLAVLPLNCRAPGG